MKHLNVPSVSSTAPRDTQRLCPFEMAKALLDRGDYLTALTLFQDCQEPWTSDHYFYQAVCLIHLEHPQKALAACDRAIELDNNHSQAWLFRGIALHRLGHFQDAYACYGRALGEQSFEPVRTAEETSPRGGLTQLKSFVKNIKNRHMLRI